MTNAESFPSTSGEIELAFDEENKTLTRTLSKEAKLTGVGIHSGLECKVIIAPADPGHGIAFTRGGEVIPATIDFADAEASDRRTVIIGKTGERFEQIEHLMAALYANGITDALVTQEGPEVPFLDGGSLEYMQALTSAGTRETDGTRPTLTVTGAGAFETGDSRFSAAPHQGLLLSVFVEFPGTIVGNAGFSLEITPKSFLEEAAPARTFALARDIEMLRNNGLIKGGTLENAVVFDQERYHTDPLNFPNEVVRHKIIDLLGDLALVPFGLRGHFWALRAGHRTHVTFARHLADKVKSLK